MIFYGQIPASFIYVCNFLGVITDRNHILPILYVSRQDFLRVYSSKSCFCMSVFWNFYGQIPANITSVCHQKGIFTDRFQQILLLYVIRKEFLRTDSSKYHFCMSSERNFYGQIPANAISVCQQTGIFTDRFHQILFLYVKQGGAELNTKKQGGAKAPPIIIS